MQKFLEKTLDVRKQEYEKISKKYPDLIPIILQRSAFGNRLPELTKYKFLVPRTLTMSSVMMLIRKHLNEKDEKDKSNENNESKNKENVTDVHENFSATSIFLFNTRNELLQGTKVADMLRKDCPSEDGFVYIRYAAENTMGCVNV